MNSGWDKVKPPFRWSVERASYHVHMADAPPLSALLSQVLVAFAIEFDNEFEHRTMHRTTNHGAIAGSNLLGGLQPYPDGWRASVASREVLPHYPMVLHRGGFPDGS